MAIDWRAGALFVFVGAVALTGAGWGDAQAKERPKPSAPIVAPCPSPSPTPAPRPPDAGGALAVKYVRDSAEYQTLTRMVYALASRAVTQLAAEHERAREAARRDGRAPDDSVLAVVLDIDETALDNSVYQLEREAYRLPFSPDSWNAWVRRQAAGVVPGVADFIGAVRQAGVRVAWISNRDDDPDSTEATRANLKAWGVWDDSDRLCLQHGDQDRSKAARRGELRAGGGACSFGAPAQVLAYMGDQLGDFPADDESGADAARATGFGRRYFLLPDPMYGGWSNKVTRKLP